MASLETLNGDQVYDDVGKATYLNEHFCSVFIGDNINGILDVKWLSEKKITSPVESYIFTETSVAGFIKNLNGPDGYPPCLYKSLLLQLTSPLTMLFKLSLQHKKLPIDWKKAVVIPVYKRINYYYYYYSICI